MRKFDISTIAGILPEWIEQNIVPSGIEYTLEGDIVYTEGELPLKEIA